jgi:2-polyprenyl-3-methyl-5-hydroxy-6-metoxy-1,4-benzoquinol methylase
VDKSLLREDEYSNSSVEKKRDFHEHRYGGPALYAPADRVRIDSILRLIGTGKTVLDIGCHDGSVSVLIGSNGNKVCALDASTEAVALAKGKGIDAQAWDIEKGLPYDNGSFDTVLMGEVIEHVFDLNGVLGEVRRVLNGGGSIVVSTPNLASLGRRILLLLGKNPFVETSMSGHAAGHVRYFVRDTLVNLFEDNGFIIDTMTSDVVNFNNSGRLCSAKLARIIPSMGKSIIIRAGKERKEL